MHVRVRINAYQNTMRVVMRITADRALATAGTDPEVAEIIRILIVVHSQTDAQLTASVTALFHHLRKGLVPTTLTVVFLQLEFLHLDHPLDYMFLPLPPATLPVIQILWTECPLSLLRTSH